MKKMRNTFVSYIDANFLSILQATRITGFNSVVFSKFEEHPHVKCLDKIYLPTISQQINFYRIAKTNYTL